MNRDNKNKIDTKYIENRLRVYKNITSTIETTRARIEIYRQSILNPDEFDEIYIGTNIEMGMPKGKGGTPSSPVEAIIKNTEANREEITETIKEWIKEDNSRIYPLQIEAEQIKGALAALTKQQQFIIDCKYYEKMIWRDIENSFNKEFNQKQYVTTEGLRKLNKKSLEKLVEILSRYYTRFKVS